MSHAVPVGTFIKQNEFDLLNFKQLATYHLSEKNLEGDIRALQKKAEKRITFQNKDIRQSILSMIDKRMRGHHNLINEIAMKEAALLGIEYKPLSIPKSVQDSVIRQVFRFLDISYSDRTKKRKTPSVQTEKMTEYEKRWWEKQNEEKRGRKNGETFAGYHGWHYYGECRKCGNELQENQTIADHMKKYHPDKTVQSGYNWFKRRTAGKRTQAVSECPRCGRHGSLYRRSDGYHVFQHDDSSQHYITKDMAEMVIENLRYKETSSTSRTSQGNSSYG